MTRLTAVAALAIVFALLAVSSVAAGEPEIRIAQLECTGNPELVVIENTGGVEQNFTGWTLVSDPASETFDLSALGGLAAGGSVTIQSGPFASGPFLQDSWGLEFVLRDDDATDYARIADNSGATVDEVACAEATPTPGSTPSPEPTPSGVINGGGPPPPPVGSLTPSLLVLAGSSMAAAGAATFALPFTWFKSTTSSAQVVVPEMPTAAPPVARPASVRRRRRRGSAVLGLALAGLLVTALLALLWRSRSS